MKSKKEKLSLEIKKEKLSYFGSMNYVVQIFSKKDSDKAQVDIYQPRRNKAFTEFTTKEELRPQVEETIERMKIAIQQMQEYLDGKRDIVYYWQLDDEKHNF